MLAAALLFWADAPSTREACRSNGSVDVGAGWSSPVARQAHNLKVAGSNPAPATNVKFLASECELGICVAPDLIRGPPSFRHTAALGRLFCCPPANVPNPTLTHFR